MFIEQLTDKQIEEFAKKNHPDYKFSFTRGNESIDYYITNTKSLFDDYSWYERYTDFGCVSTGNNHLWRNYMKSIFGDEYKRAYTEYVLEEFD